MVRKEAEFDAYDRNEVEDTIAARDAAGLAAEVARLRARSDVVIQDERPPP